MKKIALPNQLTTSQRSTPFPCRFAANVRLLLSALILPSLCVAQPFEDNFNDGNDASWTHYDPIAAALGGGTFVHYSFPNGAYRIQADPSPAVTPLGPGRGASLRSESRTDFYVAVDVVGWDDSLVQAFGPLARVTNPGPGTTLGYAFTYQNKDQNISIAKITNEEGNDISGTSKKVVLDLEKRYRFVFIGKGANLDGRVYELPDTRNPIAVTTTTEATYPSGITGLLVYNNPPPGTGGGDATFDNYLELDAEPPLLSIGIGTFGELEVMWPSDTVGFQLQFANTVPSTNWITVDGGFIITRGDKFVYTSEFQPTNTFYRLLRP